MRATNWFILFGLLLFTLAMAGIFRAFAPAQAGPADQTQYTGYREE
ncbi:MAG: hypothetical protein FWF10_00330 [Clostridiales bacterium]|nr:hypothetical protein [Clostridiales bacterium]